MLDPAQTKVVEIALVVGLFWRAVHRREITAGMIVTCFAYLALGMPLGYDTLAYSWLIESDGLSYYGPVWSTLEWAYRATGWWWSVHLAGYGLIVFTFVQLARRSDWPSLTLAMLCALPCIGFDFLSLLRQGVSTAFVILFYLALSERRPWHAAGFALLSYLAHPAGLFGVAVIGLVHLRHRPARLLMAFGGAVTAALAVALAAPSFVAAQVDNLLFLLARYIISDATIENEAGGKLVLFWVLALYLPMAVGRLRRAAWGSGYATTVTFFLLSYILLQNISGSSVRLVWLFLPFLMFQATQVLMGATGASEQGPQPLRSPPPAAFQACYIGLLAAAAIYVLAIAPEHFWEGDYPHEVHFTE